MAYDFPNTPSTGQVFSPPGGPSYKWDGAVWKGINVGIPVTVYTDANPPLSPIEDQLWYETDTDQLQVYVPPGWVKIGLAEAPNDGVQYARKNASWSPVTIDWNNLTGKPSSFPPEAHEHTQLVNGSGTGVLNTSGTLTLSGNLYAYGGSVQAISTTGHAAVVINKGVSGFYSFIDGQTAGKLRWRVYLGEATPEAGSNAGSNFLIGAYNDAGTTAVGSALVINRSTLAATFGSSLTTVTGITAGGVVTGTTAVQVKPPTAASQNIHFWFRDFADVERAIIYTATDAASDLTVRVNSKYFYFKATGELNLPTSLAAYNIYSSLAAGSAYVRVSGGISGNIGANLELYGNLHGSLPSEAYLDSTGFTLRNMSNSERCYFDMDGVRGTPGVIYCNGLLTTGAHGINTPYLNVMGTISCNGYIESTATHLHLAANTGYIYFRPVGATVTTNQSYFSSGGALFVYTTITSLNGHVMAELYSYANGGVFIGGATQVVLGAPSSTLAAVYLRPNGYNTTANQTSIDTSGNMVVSGALKCAQEFNSSTAAVVIQTTGAGNIYCRAGGIGVTAEQSTYSSAGNFTIGNQGYKAVAGDWAAASDARIKTVTGDYTTGLEAILALKVRRFTYKGNESLHDPMLDMTDPANPVMLKTKSKLTAPYEASPHRTMALAEGEYVSLIAQEAEIVMPEMVKQTEAWIDGEKVTDFRVLDPTNVTWALVNAMQEIAARLTALEGATK